MDVTEAKNFYLDQFARLEKELARNGRSRARQMREEAIARFAELGFPTTRDEEWKYTNVAPIAKTPFRPAGDKARELALGRLEQLGLGELCRNRLVFINGHYSAELSSLRRLPEGVEMGCLAQALSDGAGRLEIHLGRYADYRSHSFVALNTALMEDGALLFVPKGKLIDEPIHLLFVSTAPEKAIVSHPRNLIVLERDSQATVIESYVGWGEAVYFTNAVTEIIVGENARLDHYKVETESEAAFHIATVQASLERSSNFASHALALGGALVRNEVNAELSGEGGECTLDGLYVAARRQHVDNQTRIDHVRAHCTSRELYKGILGGTARGVFNGKICVHKAAEKSDARQTNKNLLLSEEAWIDTKPQLEIFNNDVKCTHGSTIGQVDQDALFYLRSRGIGLDAARHILTHAFASEVAGRIKVASLRNYVDQLLTLKLQEN
jgi:Fe-S cluster assembly protein SufD